ncbi:MAG: c-type cytochrome [Pseudohongiellaceae bacterium]
MKNAMLVTVKYALFVAGSVVALAASAQEKTLHDGVFTEAQAKAGEAVYEQRCVTCHDMQYYSNVLSSWQSQPLLYLWEAIMGQMPADNPGSMMFSEYTEVLAYILDGNGFPAGDTPLDPDQGMDQIKIVAPD